MDASKAIKHMLVDSGVTEAALARRVGLAPQNLNTRLKSPQNWRIDDLAMLAGALGARLECKIVMPSGDSIAITPNQKGAAPAPAPSAEQPKQAPPAAAPAQARTVAPPRPTLAELMALREQRLADQRQQEQLEHPEQRPVEQPEKKPSLLPPTRKIDTSNIPPELAAAMSRAAAAQTEMCDRLNSAEKNPPMNGTNAEQR